VAIYNRYEDNAIVNRYEDNAIVNRYETKPVVKPETAAAAVPVPEERKPLGKIRLPTGLIGEGPFTKEFFDPDQFGTDFVSKHPILKNLPFGVPRQLLTDAAAFVASNVSSPINIAMIAMPIPIARGGKTAAAALKKKYPEIYEMLTKNIEDFADVYKSGDAAIPDVGITPTNKIGGGLSPDFAMSELPAVIPKGGIADEISARGIKPFDNPLQRPSSIIPDSTQTYKPTGEVEPISATTKTLPELPPRALVNPIKPKPVKEGKLPTAFEAAELSEYNRAMAAGEKVTARTMRTSEQISRVRVKMILDAEKQANKNTATPSPSPKADEAFDDAFFKEVDDLMGTTGLKIDPEDAVIALDNGLKPKPIIKATPLTGGERNIFSKLISDATDTIKGVVLKARIPGSGGGIIRRSTVPITEELKRYGGPAAELGEGMESVVNNVKAGVGSAYLPIFDARKQIGLRDKGKINDEVVEFLNNQSVIKRIDDGSIPLESVPKDFVRIDFESMSPKAKELVGHVDTFFKGYGRRARAAGLGINHPDKGFIPFGKEGLFIPYKPKDQRAFTMKGYAEKLVKSGQFSDMESAYTYIKSDASSHITGKQAFAGLERKRSAELFSLKEMKAAGFETDLEKILVGWGTNAETRLQRLAQWGNELEEFAPGIMKQKAGGEGLKLEELITRISNEKNQVHAETAGIARQIAKGEFLPPHEAFKWWSELGQDLGLATMLIRVPVQAMVEPFKAIGSGGVTSFAKAVAKRFVEGERAALPSIIGNISNVSREEVDMIQAYAIESRPGVIRKGIRAAAEGVGQTINYVDRITRTVAYMTGREFGKEVAQRIASGTARKDDYQILELFNINPAEIVKAGKMSDGMLTDFALRFSSHVQPVSGEPIYKPAYAHYPVGRTLLWLKGFSANMGTHVRKEILQRGGAMRRINQAIAVTAATAAGAKVGIPLYEKVTGVSMGQTEEEHWYKAFQDSYSFGLLADALIGGLPHALRGDVTEAVERSKIVPAAGVPFERPIRRSLPGIEALMAGKATGQQTAKRIGAEIAGPVAARWQPRELVRGLNAMENAAINGQPVNAKEMKAAYSTLTDTLGLSFQDIHELRAQQKKYSEQALPATVKRLASDDPMVLFDEKVKDVKEERQEGIEAVQTMFFMQSLENPKNAMAETMKLFQSVNGQLIADGLPPITRDEFQNLITAKAIRGDLALIRGDKNELKLRNILKLKEGFKLAPAQGVRAIESEASP
jgi:hypothetical protein